MPEQTGTYTEPRGNRHPAVTVPYPRDSWDAIEIDAEIAPLVAALWQAGIDTEASCQHDGTAPASIELTDSNAVKLAALTGAGMGWKLEPLTGTRYNRRTRQVEQCMLPGYSALHFARSDARMLAALVSGAAERKAQASREHVMFGESN